MLLKEDFKARLVSELRGRGVREDEDEEEEGKRKRVTDVGGLGELVGQRL